MAKRLHACCLARPRACCVLHTCTACPALGVWCMKRSCWGPIRSWSNPSKPLVPPCYPRSSRREVADGWQLDTRAGNNPLPVADHFGDLFLSSALLHPRSCRLPTSEALASPRTTCRPQPQLLHAKDTYDASSRQIHRYIYNHMQNHQLQSTVM